MMRGSSFVGLVLIAFLFAAAVAQGAVLVVPSEEYDTIQSAVDAAAPGDTVQVAAGTYTEAVTARADGVNIVGAGSAVTTIDATGFYYALTVQHVADVTVSGFTIRGGLDFQVLTQHTGAVTLEDCAATGGRYGVALAQAAGHITLVDCELSGAGTSYPGLWLATDGGPGTATAIGSTFTGNHSGVNVGPGCTVDLLGCHLDANTVHGLYVDGGVANVSGATTISDNNGIGLRALNGGAVHLQNSTLDANAGWGVDITTGCVTSENTDITGNQVGVACRGGSFAATGGRIAGNRGTGVSCSTEQSSATLDGTTVSGNGSYGLLANGGSNITAAGATISANALSGARVTGSGSAVTLDATIVKTNGRDGLTVEAEATGYVVNMCTVQGNAGRGINFGPGSSGSVRDSLLRANGWSEIRCEGASPLIDGNSISNNALGYGIELKPSYGANADPATASDDVTSEPLITSNSFSGNKVAAVWAVDTAPANVAQLHLQNTYDGTNNSRLTVWWHGLVRVMRGGLPEANATASAANAAGLPWGNLGGITNTEGYVPPTAPLNNSKSWHAFLGAFVDNTGTKHELNPYSVTATSSDGTLTKAVQYSWDGQSKPYGSDIDGRYQIAIVDLLNNSPIADAEGPYAVDEGGSILVAATGSDPDGDPLTFAWDLDNSGTFETPGQEVTFSAVGFDGPDTKMVAVQVTDSGGLSATDEATVDILNVAPELDPVVLAPDPVALGSLIEPAAAFSDAGVPDTHTALWDWGDTTTSTGTVDESGGSGSVSGSHTYTSTGVYEVKLTLSDDDGGFDEAIYQFVVVYDPSGGFVTGGGWIMSPQGAYADDPSLTGKANFGFNSKYKKGATEPTGQTQFQFKVAELNFHSSSYQWLVIAGAKAQYKGVGTINGAGNFGFMLTAIDGQLNGGGEMDKFRIKIWDRDAGDDPVYDNQTGTADDSDAATALGGGSIVIHQAKENDGAASQAATAAITNASSVPTRAGAQITFSLSAPAHVAATILNIAGRPVKSICHAKACDAGTNTLLWDATSDRGTKVPSGMYLVTITAQSASGEASRAIAAVRINR